MFCIEAVTEETKDKITSLLAKVHMWVLKIVLTAANDAKIESHVPVPVMGASKDSDYNLITRRNCQRSTYIFLFINDKITCNGRHQDLEEWAKTGSPDTVILYLYWGSGQKPNSGQRKGIFPSKLHHWPAGRFVSFHSSSSSLCYGPECYNDYW